MKLNLEKLLDSELEKFSRLCKEEKFTMPMFSDLIDDRWHQRMKFGGDLEGVSHDSSIKSNVPIEIEWVKYYEARYGQLSKFWFMDRNENLVEEKYNLYLSCGKVFSSFNCAGKFNLI
jgi:hypothetical protein